LDENREPYEKKQIKFLAMLKGRNCALQTIDTGYKLLVSKRLTIILHSAQVNNFSIADT